MSKSLALYDEALHIGQLELNALKAEEVEKADEYCNQRAQLLENAWNIHDAENEQIRSKLLAIKTLQEELIQEGTKLKKDIQQQLSTSKKQQKVLKGYKLSVGQATSMLDSELHKLSIIAQ